MEAIFILVYFRFFNKALDFKNIILCILALTASMSHEIIAIFLLLSHITLFLLAKKINYKLPKNFMLTFISSIFGLLYLLLSPGNNSRASYEADRYDYLSLGDLLNMGLGGMLERAYISLSNFASQTPLILFLLLFILVFFRIYTIRVPYKMITLGILSLCLFFFLILEYALLGVFILLLMQGYVAYKDKSRFNIIMLALFITWLLMGLAYIQFAKNIPLRARSIDLILLISICIIYLQLYVTKIKGSVLALCTALICVFFINTAIEYYKLHLNWNALIAYVEEQKRINGSDIDIVYKKEDFNNSYFMISPFFNLSKPQRGYFDISYALGVRSIKFE